ncbi:MAG: acetyl-CoA C-acetyltransferase [Proteobacteria bacterium]|nr:acetyl-CoA C-acetyltransferase [Pseudomonadota bacterium]
MSNDNDIVIVAALRSAVGNFNGAAAQLSAVQLSTPVAAQMLASTGVVAKDIDEVIMGQVLSAATGQNSARQLALGIGMPHESTAWVVNQVCGSGLWSVALGAQSITAGVNNIVISGGHESMSCCPHAVHLRNGVKMGATELRDLMIDDGLTDVFSKLHMGLTAEAVAEKYGVSRQDQDELAVKSQNNASNAQKSGKFKDEIVPITISNRKGDVTFIDDEFIRHNATVDVLSALKPAFKKDGTVTAGNASGINDGAAVIMLMKRKEAEKRGLAPLATIRSFASSGVDPMMMGIGPVSATNKALSIAGWQIKDLELVEANEAFAAQAVAVNRLLGFNTDIVNVNGGAIAIGHPIGASGARILVTLLHEMKRRNVKRGLATLCVGGGMGVAMCVERV